MGPRPAAHWDEFQRPREPRIVRCFGPACFKMFFRSDPFVDGGERPWCLRPQTGLRSHLMIIVASTTVDNFNIDDVKTQCRSFRVFDTSSGSAAAASSTIFQSSKLFVF